MTASARPHAVFARGEVDDLYADRALARLKLNDTKVARGQGHEVRAVLQCGF